MCRILLVEDDKTQCMSLGLACTSKGYEVEMATDGSAAIDIGMRFRPDVLVTDWMLGGQIDGILVSETLRTINDETQTILVTGYASPDLRKNALAARIFGFFEKPLDLERVLTGISMATEKKGHPPNHSIGLLEFEEDGTILHANSRARKLLGLPEKLPAGEKLARFLSYRSLLNVDTTDGKWFSLSRLDGEPTCLGYVKGRQAATRLLLLIEKCEELLREHRVMKALIDSAGPDEKAGPTDARVLLVDPDDLQRRLAVTQLENMGVFFHSAESFERGLHILEEDPQIHMVILDYGPPDGDITDVVRKIRELRPEVTVAGTSTGFRKREFEAMGIEKFLTKPLTAASLSALLRVGG